MTTPNSRLSSSTDSHYGAGATASNSTLLCVPLVSKSVEQMVAEMRQAKANGADLVEIRLDHLSHFQPRQDLEILLKGRPLPALITYRPKWEGGQYEGDESKRFDVLRLAMELGAEYIDVELKVAHEFMNYISGNKPDSVKLIVSSHNYQSTPSLEELAELVVQIQATGADIVKIATMSTDITDVARMFQTIVHCQVPIIGLVMSERGVTSRLLCPKFGGYLTFCTLDAGKESAPGQPTLKDLKDVYHIRELKPDTKVFGIIGKPVGHSKSPLLHNTSFRSIGINAVYVPFLVDNLENFLNAFSSPDFAGFSCTIPHKEAAVKCCDEVDPIAKAIGAVNTIIRRPSDGKLIGYNTDYIGAISAIEDGIRGSNISANGAGSTSPLAERARELANLIGGDAITLDELNSFQPEKGMILANSTSMGMHPKVDETPISQHALSSYAVVFDAVYTPKVTRLLREAELAGATTVSGLEMFIRQAMGQFELFTGLPAPAQLMREIVTKYV